MIAWATYPYQGQVILVSRAGTGTGRATARAFLEQGASVAVRGRRAEPLRETPSCPSNASTGPARNGTTITKEPSP
ncbi:hypothetical protein ACWDSL_26185 [Streptomyces sp. NPDC000941]